LPRLSPRASGRHSQGIHWAFLLFIFLQAAYLLYVYRVYIIIENPKVMSSEVLLLGKLYTILLILSPINFVRPFL
jgi:hypothetical protein